MKKLSYLALAAVGLLLGACSSDKDVADNQSGNLSQDDDQFVSLSINLPTTPQASTRNGDTDDNNYGDGTFELNDGLASEYVVKDALLVMFHPVSSGSEDDATFVGAYDISPEPWTPSSDKQVTKYSAKIVQKVGSTVTAGDLALVILNRNNLVSFTSSTLTVGSTTMGSGKTYKDFREAILTTTALGAAVMTSNGFYMANAPLTDKQGSTTTDLTGATVRTLVPIANVYQTEAAALAGDPADIYVERGMAKVTLQPLSTTLKLGSDADKAITFLYWTLDHTNKKSYAVRSTEGHSDFIKLVNQVSKKYRYAGMTDIIEGNPGDYKYRTYFAKDPNYDAPVVTTGSDIDLSYATTSNYTNKVGDDYPQYCFENTFDVDNQKVENTTLVRLKVQVGDGDDLYIVNEKRATIYDETGVQTLAKNAAVDYVEAQAALDEIEVTGTVDPNDFVVTVSKTAGDATVTITKASTFDGKITTGSVSLADLQAAVDASLKSVVCYAGGESYYTIRIKHFGDQLTPWHTGNALEDPQPVVGNIYPAGSHRDDNYLGRYGVLRNNWYNLVVKSIQYLGEPTPKDYKNDPTTDDELDGYISVRINVLSWAKRTQNWDL